MSTKIMGRGPNIVVVVPGEDSKKRRKIEYEDSEDSDNSEESDSEDSEDSDSDYLEEESDDGQKPLILLVPEPVKEPDNAAIAKEVKEDSDLECNSDCGCEEDCECETVRNCPKKFKRRPHNNSCKCEKCTNWDLQGVLDKPHKEWGCDCSNCKEWTQAYFLLLHPNACECKYCAFAVVKTRFNSSLKTNG
jgi:hypothetical protein